MKFYKDNKVNPFSSCLPLLIQLPILIALYRAFLAVAQTDPSTHILLAEQLKHLYEPSGPYFPPIRSTRCFSGLSTWPKRATGSWPSWPGQPSFGRRKMLMAKQPPKLPGAKDESMMAGMNKQMMYFMPVLTVIFGLQFPAGLTLYWLFSTLFTVAQQYYIFKQDKVITNIQPVAKQ